MSEIELENCAFCESSRIEIIYWNGNALMQAKCFHCGTSSGRYSNEITLCNKWNTRPENPRIAELEAENERTKNERDEYFDRLTEIRRENQNVRYLLARLAPECIHCGLTDVSKCHAGFPGCGVADDLNYETPELKQIADKWRQMQANKNAELEAENERLKIAIRRIYKHLLSNRADDLQGIPSVEWCDIEQAFQTNCESVFEYFGD